MLKALLDTVQKDQRHRYEAYKHWARCLDADMTAVDGTELSYLKFYGSELTINEALNTLETLHAQVFKNKILPAPCPSEGDYDDEFQARAFGRWLEGVFDDGKVFQEAVPQQGWDCLWAGTGLIKCFYKPTGKGKRAKLHYEAVSPRHIYVDITEARMGRPRSIHQKMYMDRWVASDLFGDTEDRRKKIQEFEETSEADFDRDVSYQGDGDQICVWESWHLPSGPTAGDGKHCIWINNCTLMVEEWKEDRFPFTIMRFGQREAGFYGKSAFARIQPAQKAFDRITKQIDEAHQVMAVPRIIVRKDSGIQVAHIDDIPFSIIETESPTADIREWNAVPINPAMYQERDGLTRRMRGSIGVSDYEAQNSIPTNIRDGAAAYMDRAVESGQARHAMLHDQYENAMMDLADLSLMIAWQAEQAGYDIVVRAPGNAMKSTVEMLNFSKVKIRRDNLKLRVLPMSQLPRTFAQRIKDLTLLRDRGDITQKAFLRMLEIPDVESQVDEYVADEDVIKRNLSYMIRTGNYISPLPYDNHDLIVKLTALKINEARCREVDEDTIALLVQYIEDALELKNGINPPAPMLGPEGAPGQAFAPPGPPMVPPGTGPGGPPQPMPQGPPQGPPPGPPVMGPG